MEKLFVPVIAGATRPERRSMNVAKLVAKIGNEIDGVETVLVDPLNFNLTYDSSKNTSKDEEYTALVTKADAYFIVTPEYNHGVPGSLKALLDKDLKNYIHKPVAIAGVSAGPWGGVRAIESLVPIVRELGMQVTFTDVNFTMVADLFDEEGKLLDEKFIKRTQRVYTELIWMAKTLKWGRKNVASEHHP